MKCGISTGSGGEGVLDQKVSPKRGRQPFTERRLNSLKTRRRRLPWPADKPFRILSLDGGGIRGVYAATILARVEREIVDGGVAGYVDMIAGTSTGGIIAIGLGLGKPASSIERLYVEDGQFVFPPFWTRHSVLRFCRQLFFSLHSQSALEKLLYGTFGDVTLGRSSSRLVIPAFLGPRSQIAVLKTDHHPDFANDHRMAAWEACRATSAAPTYLPGHAGDGYVFLDGGVWANNPVMVAIVDALSAYDVTREQVEVLSIGSGNPPYEFGPLAVRGGLFQWRDIVNGAVFLTTDNAQAQADLLLGPERILRLEPDGPAAAIDLADWERAVATLPALAHAAFEDNRDQLKQFFTERVAARHRFYTEP